MRKTLTILAVLLGMASMAFAQHNQNITLPEKPKNRAQYVDYSMLRSGYWCAVQLGGFYGSGFAAQADFVNGYRFSEWIKVGAGVSYDYNFRGFSTLPVYVDVRGNIISQEDTMFAIWWSADAGYSVGLDPENKGGVYFSPGIGIRQGGIRHNFILSLNYMMQGQSFEDTSRNQLLHFVGLKLGYEF